MTVRVEGGLERSADAWDELVAALPIPSPFLRSWWLEGTAADGRVYVQIWEGSELIGGLALDRAGPAYARAFRFAANGPLTPDHLDLVAAPDRRAEVVDAASGWLRANARIVLAEGLVPDSALAAALPDARVADIGAAPLADLSGGADAYFGARRTRFVQNLRRDERRLTKAGHRVETIPVEETATALRRFRELHDAQWGSESNFLSCYAEFERAALLGAARGEVVLYGVRGDDGLGAVEITFHGAGRMSLYQGARQTELPGARAVIYFDAIKQVCEAGYRELDLLRGDEHYKMRWADGLRRVWGLRWGRGAAGVGLRVGDAAYATARSVAHRMRRPREQMPQVG